MRTRWEDLATRARGLATHLLGEAELDALAGSPDLSALRDAMHARGVRFADGPVTPDGLEQAVRRAASARLRTLAAWGRARTALLAVIFEDEDRLSLRAILRGAVQHAPAEQRLAGLIATPMLPERALATLSTQVTPAAIATLLVAWDNPYGASVYREATAGAPNILTIELLLNMTFAERALLSARESGSQALIDFVRETIDIENATTALVLASGETEIPPRRAFLGGGTRLALEAFLDAASAGEPGEAGRRLAAAFRPDPLAHPFEQVEADPAAVEDAVLRARIARLRAVEAQDPAGAAAVLSFALRLRAEVRALRRVIWGVALGTPRGTIAAAMGGARRG